MDLQNSFHWQLLLQSWTTVHCKNSDMLHRAMEENFLSCQILVKNSSLACELFNTSYALEIPYWFQQGLRCIKHTNGSYIRETESLGP